MSARSKQFIMVAIPVALLIIMAGFFFFTRHNQDLAEGPVGEIASNEARSIPGTGIVTRLITKIATIPLTSKPSLT